MDNNIPTVWRQSKIIAILKPGKDSSIPKNYLPKSILCHMLKLYEIMMLNRITPAIEQHLIKEQAGFRSGESCTSQLLNLTQHIEDGYEEGMITGTAFLSPTLCNIYTNDQPILDGTRGFIYADDLCITAQYPTLQEVEQIDTLLQKQQSACKSRQDASHGALSAE